MHERPQRTVLITGGARGIGAAIATELSSRGYKIIKPTRTEMDLGDPESIDGWLAAAGGLDVDILINNAGINVLSPLTTLDSTALRSMLQTNVTAAIRLIQAFVPGMKRRAWGRILNLSTVFSLVTKEQRAAYSMTKAALNALTRSAAVELGPDGILVNALAPGYVDTDLTRQNNSPEALAAISAAIPLRRLARSAELAKTAAFLVSDENTYLTGQTIIVDGGFTCQ
jgi:3-oxoacyl-[acyl-carrier protein] reductase